MSLRSEPRLRVGARRHARRTALRRAAESRAATRKAARVLRRAREAAAEAALASARFRSRATLDPRDDLGAVRNLLGLARVDRGRTQRVIELYQLLARVLPSAANAGELPWVLLLAMVPWHRDPRAFRAPAGDAEGVRGALLRHLLGPYPAPAFLRSALDVDRLAIARVPLEDAWGASHLAWVARGRSLREAVGTLLPAGFTRAMCHAFLVAGPRSTPIVALRHAQVAGLGGPPAFAERLLLGRLGAWLGPAAEAAWHAWLGWACRQPWLVALAPGPLEDVVAWVEDERRRRPGFTCHGRTAASVARAVEAFVALRDADGARLGRAGLRGLRDLGCEVRELASAKDLVAEGQRMGHCVAAYLPLVASGKVAVFGLSGPGAEATVEVVRGLGLVVQVKGRRNAPPTDLARALVRRWAERNGLTCAFPD
jgi:hypothetical protein